jgi:hypothetical protein
MDKKNPDSFFLDYAKEAFQREEGRRESIGLRATTFIAFNTVLLGALYFSVNNLQSIASELVPWVIILSVLTTIAQFSSLILSMAVLLPRGFFDAIDPRGLYENYKEKTEKQTTPNLISTLVDAYEKNRSTNNSRIHLMNLAIWITVCNAVLILLFIIFGVFYIYGSGVLK